MSRVAEPLPMVMVARILGLSDRLAPLLKKQGYASVERISGFISEERISELEHVQLEDLAPVIEAYTEAKANSQAYSGAMIGILAKAVVDGELTDFEAMSILTVLIAAGGESTTSLTGTAVRLLAERLDMQELLRDDPLLIPTFVEEACRFDPPFRGHYRVTTRDVELGGKVLPAGSHLVLMWPAANRDPAEFENPDEVRLDRPTRVIISVLDGVSISVWARRSHGWRPRWPSRRCWPERVVCRRSRRTSTPIPPELDGSPPCFTSPPPRPQGLRAWSKPGAALARISCGPVTWATYLSFRFKCHKAQAEHETRGNHVPKEAGDHCRVAGGDHIGRSNAGRDAAGASSPGVTSKTVTLGLITSLTGPSGPEDAGIIPAAQARIDQQNAEGGVDGRQIKLITEDDQTNPATNQTATSALLSEGVFGVIDLSAVTFGGYKLLQQQGVPVTGGAYDGPEWNEQPNTNMFSFSGPGDPKDPQYSTDANFAKAHGGTKCGALGYSISPSSQASASGFELSCERAGLKNAYLNTTVPFGSVNVTTLALQIKAAGVDTLWLPLDEVTNFALMTALKQDGVNMKVIPAPPATGSP